MKRLEESSPFIPPFRLRKKIFLMWPSIPPNSPRTSPLMNSWSRMLSLSSILSPSRISSYMGKRYMSLLNWSREVEHGSLFPSLTSLSLKFWSLSSSPHGSRFVSPPNCNKEFGAWISCAHEPYHISLVFSISGTCGICSHAISRACSDWFKISLPGPRQIRQLFLHVASHHHVEFVLPHGWDDWSLGHHNRQLSAAIHRSLCRRPLLGSRTKGADNPTR